MAADGLERRGARRGTTSGIHAGRLLAAGLLVLARIHEGLALTVRRWASSSRLYRGLRRRQAFYSRYLPWERILTNSVFSPFSRVSTPCSACFAAHAGHERIAAESWRRQRRAGGAPTSAILNNLRDVLALNAHLRSVPGRHVLLADGAGTRAGGRGPNLMGLRRRISWLGSMAVAYAFHVATKASSSSTSANSFRRWHCCWR